MEVFIIATLYLIIVIALVYFQTKERRAFRERIEAERKNTGVWMEICLERGKELTRATDLINRQTASLNFAAAQLDRHAARAALMHRRAQAAESEGERIWSHVSDYFQAGIPSLAPSTLEAIDIELHKPSKWWAKHTAATEAARMRDVMSAIQQAEVTAAKDLDEAPQD